MELKDGMVFFHKQSGNKIVIHTGSAPDEWLTKWCVNPMLHGISTYLILQWIDAGVWLLEK